MGKNNIPNGNPSFPSTRMRRNRLNNWSRRLIQENKLSTDDLIWPIFITDKNKKSSIDSMPGIFRIPLNEIVDVIGESQNYDIPAIALFPETNPRQSIIFNSSSHESVIPCSNQQIAPALTPHIIVPPS